MQQPKKVLQDLKNKVKDTCSQEDVSKQISVSKQTVMNALNFNFDPKFSTVLKIANTIGYKLKWIKK